MCKQEVQRKEIVDKKQEHSAAIFCLNNNCYAKQLKNIIHFVSKKAFDIDGLGKKIVEQLLNKGLIKNPADIFTLTVGDLEPLERFASKSADNLVKAVQNAKNISLDRFIYALGINHVGEETAIALAKEFGSLDNIMTANLERLENINDVGPQVAKSIVEYLTTKESQELIKDLLVNGIRIMNHELKIMGRKFDGKTFVLTGTLQTLTRDEIKNKIRELGGSVSGSISKKTDFVVVGDNPGSKYTKAKSLGVKILGEEEVVAMLINVN